MSFITLKIACDEEKRELLFAELSLFPFDAFEETDDGLLASCEKDAWEPAEVKPILDRYQVPYEVAEVEKVNWNEEWEKNYEPVIVGDQCIVRATFHAPRPEFPYEIIITPKMSFGTGHHATTYQVLAYQLELDHADKRVLDVGCGTGALAIMAHKRGAAELAAVDIDEWCIENSQENFALNNCGAVNLKLGGIDQIAAADAYDIILANINKNVLLSQMDAYAERLADEGVLILSGFYEEDIPDLLQCAEALGLKEIKRSERNRWAMLALRSG
ncbi:50S ribosomal protein L11 methyltransferase [Marinoscillum furvescens]|uniref:Ribosomal protein L11 methyltransferase n=1 Tax=Marinoscillum furvescens DSM 4134 TaxID=1122208 RepID=A0A3D9L3G1_MARFU|nr:50S ribosomal protein L11 methyltransferase [Marinoscillum furvescens]RED98942.1 [LSU ribosomal protein L11P]-lysine N-methyltransferase [Marinoscillum furvescens DSM 4134]